MSLDKNLSLTYLGHSTLFLTTPGGKNLLIDPWTQGNPACPADWKDPSRFGRIDLILMTHIHNDHVGDAERIAKAYPEASIVGIYEACNWLGSKDIDNLRPMNKGGTQVIEGIEITMTHAFHSSSFTEPDGRVVYGGEPAGYILTLENGFTVYAAGDTALFGDMALLRTLYAPDLALLPIGDHFTMGPREASHAVRMLGVSHVVPIHYATFPLLTGTPEELQGLLKDLPHVTIHALQPGETLT